MPERAVEDAADRQAAKIIAVVEVCDEELKRPCGIAFGGGNLMNDGFEKRLQIRALVGRVELGNTGFRIGVDNRKIELVFGGVEIDEQVVDLVQYFLNTRVRAVDFVDDQHRR